MRRRLAWPPSTVTLHNAHLGNASIVPVRIVPRHALTRFRWIGRDSASYLKSVLMRFSLVAHFLPLKRIVDSRSFHMFLRTHSFSLVLVSFIIIHVWAKSFKERIRGENSFTLFIDIFLSNKNVFIIQGRLFVSQKWFYGRSKLKNKTVLLSL